MNRVSKIFNICNIYILLLLMYYSQGIIGITGSIISRGILVVILAISVYYIYRYRTMFRFSTYFKYTNILVSMFLIYGGLYMLYNRGTKVSTYIYIQQILLSFLPVYTFYIFTMMGLLTRKAMAYWFVLFMMSSSVGFFYIQSSITESEGVEETINNGAYTFVALMPMIFLFEKKKLMQSIAMGICGYFIIMSFKRGAMLIGAVCLIIFLYRAFVSAKGLGKIIIVIVGVAMAYIGVYLVQDMLLNSALFNRRLEETMEGNSSGRDWLYAKAWDTFTSETNPIRFLFGYGANGTVEVMDQFAHNDWLEICINQGLLGLIIYFLYFVGFFKSWIRLRKINKTLFVTLGIALFISFGKTLFSMSYSNTIFYVTMVIGYCMAYVDSFKVPVELT